MKVTVIGAGAMGGSFGGLLALGGHDVVLVDSAQGHVDAIVRDGLALSGVHGEKCVSVPAFTRVEDARPADLVIFFVDTNATVAAAQNVASALTPEGYAVTCQNGIGNVEALQAVLGNERVLGGSSMCSAANLGPGQVCLTHLGPTSIGETDGRESERAAAVVEALSEAGLPAVLSNEIMAQIWQKFVLNVGINAICATTGLRPAEVASIEELAALQDRVIDEAFAVTRAKGMTLPEVELRAKIKSQRLKLNRPSMLQHIDAGRPTEIDAINGALVREAGALDIPVPYNEALTALLKGREHKARQLREQPDLDYDQWQAQLDAATT